MGLDMYLFLRRNRYQGFIQKDNVRYPQIMKDFEENIKERDYKSVVIRTDYKIGYWRKFNALHNWFIQHCADGVDECQDIYLSKEQLCGLKGVCEAVLENHDLANDCLPTKDGFFFGSLSYDDWYFKELEYTKDLLDKLIDFLSNNHGGGKSLDYYTVVYHASW